MLFPFWLQCECSQNEMGQAVSSSRSWPRSLQSWVLSVQPEQHCSTHTMNNASMGLPAVPLREAWLPSPTSATAPVDTAQPCGGTRSAWGPQGTDVAPDVWVYPWGLQEISPGHAGHGQPGPAAAGAGAGGCLGLQQLWAHSSRRTKSAVNSPVLALGQLEINTE